MDRVTVRPARQEDVAQILTFIKELATYEKLLHEVEASEESLRRALFGRRPYAEALIGELGGEPNGFALFFHNFSTFLGRPGIYLEDLYVRPAARGRGLGKALLREIARLAKERDCGRLEWAVLDWNEPAIAFYEGLGAELKREWLLTRVTRERIASMAES